MIGSWSKSGGGVYTPSFAVLMERQTMYHTPQHLRTRPLARLASSSLFLLVFCLLTFQWTGPAANAAADGVAGPKAGIQVIVGSAGLPAQPTVPSFDIQGIASQVDGAPRNTAGFAWQFSPGQLCGQPLSVESALASNTQSLAFDGSLAICDDCRSICAKSCSSYACKACDRSRRCGPYVASCTERKRK